MDATTNDSSSHWSVFYKINTFRVTEGAPFLEGCFGIFGHGNVAGMGQALEQNPSLSILSLP